MTACRVWCLAAMSAAALCAAPKVVGGPYVVNATSRGATVAWIVETDQVTYQASRRTTRTILSGERKGSGSPEAMSYSMVVSPIDFASVATRSSASP